MTEGRPWERGWEKVRNNKKENHLPLIQDLGMCPFFIIMRSCDILGTCTVHHSTKNEGVNSLASKTQYEHQSLKQNNILWLLFSSQPYFLFSRCGWVVCLLAYPFFVCFMMDLMLKILSVVAKCQMIILLTIVKPKNIWRKFVLFNLPILLFSGYETWTTYFFVMFKTDQKNANQLEILKFDWNFFQLHFDSRRLLYW